ncbi:MAG: mechanosensitive ion channel family protein [Candidatus Aenigmatarchaeota archaeon]
MAVNMTLPGQNPFEGTALAGYFTAIVVFAIFWIALKIFEKVVVRKLKSLSKKTKNDYDDALIGMLEGIGWPLYLMLSLYAAFHFAEIPALVTKYFNYLLFAVVIYYAVRSVQRLIDFALKKVVAKKEAEEGGFDPSVLELMVSIVKWTLWVIALLLFLQNQGYEISALIAGLGIGGIAIAFALQNILADIFSFFSISFDKPFKTGDYIVIGTDMGTVKKIGIKSTRIQTLQGEELVVSNRELTESRVRNYKRMEKRRIVFGIGVVYGTPNKKLEKIPKIIQGIIDPIKITDFDRAHFKSFGDSALLYEVVYYIRSSEYIDYMDTQQEINLKLKAAFEKEGIEMAFPTQTIFLAK